ncbi:MAG: pyridoxal phosphate-dependent aminotransferase [Gammaproteobacteria bacterium]
MDLAISQRASRVKPSPTLTVSARAAAMRATGEDVISLAAGEPDFDTPEHVKEAAAKAMREGFTKYTAVEGIPSLKKAIVDKFKHDNGLEYSPQQVLVSVGCKHSFYNLAQALLNPGDEVLIPAPYWVSYPDMVLLADANPVVIETSMADQFKLTPQRLARALTPRTRLLVINSPCNPTGGAYTREELRQLGQVLGEHPRVLIASDDIYEHIYWGEEPFVNILGPCPQLAPRTVVLNGVSKAYAMTGWRIGYAAGPLTLIEAMATLQSQSTSNPVSIAQKAAQAALEGPQDLVREHCRIFRARHDYVLARLQQLPGVECVPCAGTFYVFPDMRGAMARLDNVRSDIELAEFILDKAKLALVPGSAFGAAGHLRLSFATGMETLERAMDRLAHALSR